MASSSSQKFIGRNRPPRVQIEYDVEVYGSEKKIQLPFIVGVMADLSGKPAEPLPSVDERKYLEVDIDNFDERMKAIKPRVAFHVPNTLTGEGQLAVDLTFRENGRFLACRGCQERRTARQTAYGPSATGKPYRLHGWEIWSRGRAAQTFGRSRSSPGGC